MIEQLTKDMLIELGWKHLSGFFWYWPYDTYNDAMSSRPISWRLNFVQGDDRILIDYYERNDFYWSRCFEGPCRTEEEMKYLMRLFNIQGEGDLQEDIELFKKENYRR